MIKIDDITEREFYALAVLSYCDVGEFNNIFSINIQYGITSN